MKKNTPNFLRLHCDSDTRESDSRTLAQPRRSRESVMPSANTSLDQFWEAYSAATGWRIDARHRRQTGQIKLLPAITPDVMSSGEEMEAMVSQHEAMKLAELALTLTEDLKKSRRALRRQAAELAARAAVIGGESGQLQLAKTVQRVLADAAQACGCDAAALYLLDDDTRYLNLRFAHQLSDDSMTASPRELRHCRGDLEAMVQNVVAIDDLKAGDLDTWNCPETAQAAICANVAVDDLPIGTLWLFSDRTQSFDSTATATAKLTASHLARELSAAATSDVATAARATKTIVRDIAAWQQRALPAGTELAERWSVDGMIESPRDWAIGWHCWDILPDGTLLLAMAEAADETITGAMVATVARTALTAHTGYRHSPKQLVQRISDTLWQTNTGDQLISLVVAHIQPDSGEGEIAAAGNLNAIIASRYGYRPLLSETTEPLGICVDPNCIARTFHMTPGETLMAYSQGWSCSGATQQSLGDTLRKHYEHGKSLNPLVAIRQRFAGGRMTCERGAVSLSVSQTGRG